MTSKLTREQMLERARENVKALKMASRQHAFESAREEILADLQIAEYALACLEGVDSEPVATLDVQSRRPDGNKFALVFSSAAHKLPDDVYFLYRHAQQPVAHIPVLYKGAELLSRSGLELIRDGASFATDLESACMAEALLSAARPEPVTQQEPIAWLNDAYLARGVVDGEAGSEDAGPGYIPVYRESSDELASIVPDEMTYGQAETCSGWESCSDAWADGWNACRAAMLHAQSDDDGEPTDDERIMAIEGIHNCERCSDEGWVIGEMGITRCACGQAGNSPVIPDTWIPVSERMPEVGVKVLCFPVKDEPIHATFNGQLWLQDVSWSGSEEPIDNVIPVSVTHWMPLPAAPQEVKGE